MNDLNSVFMVGTVQGKVEQKDEYLSFSIKNNYNVFDEEKKEYHTESNVYFVMIKGKVDKLLPIVKGRAGVNGRLSGNTIVAYTIQSLA